MMELKEYKEKLSLIKQEFQFQKKRLAKEFTISNNQVLNGDIITDHIGSILVDNITFTMNRDVPECVYYGVMVTKKGKPHKRGKRRAVYQSNIRDPKIKEHNEKRTF